MSWDQAAAWYNQLLSTDGDYTHREIVVPKTLDLVTRFTPKGSAILDVACGQGLFTCALSKAGFDASGVDTSAQMISFAKKKYPNLKFEIGDAKGLQRSAQGSFEGATMLLALQNMDSLRQVAASIRHILKEDGCFYVVALHPCFRIPRQSSWGIDEGKKLQYRRVDRYLTDLPIPITIHPGKSKSPQVTHFHHSMESILKEFLSVGFSLIALEEWTSNKQSVGKWARAENLARQEFPLFLSFVLRANSKVEKTANLEHA